MSSAAHLRVDLRQAPTPAQWQDFARDHGIVHSPNTVGGHTWYAGEVEVKYPWGLDQMPPLDTAAEGVATITFSTFQFGKACPEVYSIALAAWVRFGGQLSADPEVRYALTEPLQEPEEDMDFISQMRAAAQQAQAEQARVSDDKARRLADEAARGVSELTSRAKGEFLYQIRDQITKAAASGNYELSVLLEVTKPSEPEAKWTKIAYSVTGDILKSEGFSVKYSRHHWDDDTGPLVTIYMVVGW